MILPSLWLNTKRIIVAMRQKIVACIDASDPNSPPVNHSSPLISDFINVFEIPKPETFAPKIAD